MKHLTRLVTEKQHVHGYRGHANIYFTLECGHYRTEDVFSGPDKHWIVGKSKVRCYECSKIERYYRNPMKPEFNSRETYIAWRAEWKRQYKEVTENIRALKWARAYTQRLAAGIGGNATDCDRFNEIKKKFSTGQFWGPEYSLFYLRKRATAMLETRKEAKVEAQRQYQEHRGKVCPNVPSEPVKA